MFEIIMLFAFLYAAASQLLPAGPSTTRAPSNGKTRHGREKTGSEQRPAQKRTSAQALPAKTENGGQHFAQAA